MYFKLAAILKLVFNRFYFMKSGFFVFRNDFKEYSLQSRLHFRIHAAQTDLRAREKKAGPSTPIKEVENVLPYSSSQTSSNGNGNSFLQLPSTEEEAIRILQGP